MTPSILQVGAGLLLTCLYVAAPLTVATFGRQSKRTLLIAAAWSVIAAVSAPLIFR